MSEMPTAGSYGCFVKDPNLTTWICDIEGLGQCGVNFTVSDPAHLNKGWLQGRILKVIGKHVVNFIPKTANHKTALATVSHFEKV